MKILRLFENKSAQLLLLAGVSGLVYLLIFTLPFLLPNYYNTIPPVDYTKLTHYSVSGFLAYVAGIVILFALYVSAINLLLPPKKSNGRQPAVNGRFIFGSSAAFAIILIFSYPLTAIDLFVYAIRTRGWALYGLPPLATSPNAFPVGEPWLGLAGEWGNAASPYGPVWEWLSLGTFYLSGGIFLGQLFALKIIAFLACLGCGWLLYQTLKSIQPAWATAGTIAFTWNPLVLFESVQNGHNDIVMSFFLLAAIWVNVRTNKSRKNWVTGSWGAGNFLICLMLILSVSVKFITVMVVPFFLLALVKHHATWPKRFGVGGVYGAIIAAGVLALMQPLWPGWDKWAVLQSGSQAGRSLLAFFILGLRNFLASTIAFNISQNLILLAFSLIYGYYLWHTLKAIDQPGYNPVLPVYPSFYSLFWYVLLVAPVFHAWYLLWFLPLAPLLLPQQRQLTASIVFSITALLVIPYFETIRVWYPILLQNHLLGHLIGVLFLVLPPAITLLWPISTSAGSEVLSVN